MLEALRSFVGVGRTLVEDVAVTVRVLLSLSFSLYLGWCEVLCSRLNRQIRSMCIRLGVQVWIVLSGSIYFR